MEQTEKSTFMAWIVRQGVVERWALPFTIKKENVAEHCHQVAAIAHLLCVIKNKKFGGDYNPEYAATLAVFHELSESKHQDLNSGTKYSDPQLTEAFKRIEHLAEVECVDTLPAYLRDEYRGLIIQKEVEPKYKDIVKSADHLAAYIKVMNELKFGNQEYVHIREELEAKLIPKCETHPEVREFMEVFCEAGMAGMEVIRGATEV